MSFRNTQERWGRLAQFMHWTTALLILITFPVGWLANSLERGAAARSLFDLHFSIGALIFLLVVARIAWRFVDAPPSRAENAGPLLAGAAKATHVLLHLAIVVAIASGYVIQIHMRPSLDVLGLVRIQRPFQPGEDETLRAFAWYVHTYCVWALLGLVALHAGAALWHHFVRRDQVLSRMMPTISKSRRVPGRTANPERNLGEAA